MRIVCDGGRCGGCGGGGGDGGVVVVVVVVLLLLLLCARPSAYACRCNRHCLVITASLFLSELLAKNKSCINQ